MHAIILKHKIDETGKLAGFSLTVDGKKIDVTEYTINQANRKGPAKITITMIADPKTSIFDIGRNDSEKTQE